MSDTIIQNGKTFSIIDITGSHTALPVANYLVQYDEMKDEYRLELQSDFNIPSKIYGDLSYTHRWKKSFESTIRNLGILLSGYKGNGKTLTAQAFCKMMGIPVIFVTKGYNGASFESFITNPLFNNCIVFIDEFEKLYNEEQGNEDSLLSIMDGIYSTHLIFLLTVNDSKIISDKLKNRLSRIKYHKQYSTVDPSIIDDAINDLLVNKDHEPSIREVLDIIPTISLDILMSLIKEVNLFDEPATSCIKHLNIVKEEVFYEISISDGKKRRFCSPRDILFPDGYFNTYYTDDYDPDDETENWPYGRVQLKSHEIQKIPGGYTLKYDEVYTITLLRADIDTFLTF